MIDFEWYRSFVAIYQTGTVSAAAQRRLMTQPAISQHLAALEKALEMQLFERTPRRMLPTEWGKELYSQTIAAVERLEGVERSRQGRSTQRLTLRVGMPSDFFYQTGLARLAAAPGFDLRLRLRFGTTAELVAQLEAGDFDAVVATQKLNGQRVHYLPLDTETFVLIAPPLLAPPLAADPEIAEAWLLQQSWISYSPELPMIRRFWQDSFGKRPEILPRLVIPELRSMIRAVELGFGLSVVPLYLCQTALDQHRLQIPWTPPQPCVNQLYFACLRDRLRQPEIQALLQVLQPNRPVESLVE